MSMETFRTILGCVSALLGLTLIVASSQRMYAEESRLVDQAIHKRNLMSMVTAAECDHVDPELVGRVIFLEGCPMATETTIETLRDRAKNPSEDQPLIDIGAYHVCTAPGAAAIPAAKIVPPAGSVRGEAIKWENNPINLPASCSAKAATPSDAKAEEETPAATGSNRIMARRGVLSADTGSDRIMARRGDSAAHASRASLVAVQGPDGVLLPLKALHAGHDLLIIESGVMSMESLSDSIQTKPPSPRELAVLLVFAGCLAAVLGLAEIPAHTVPGPVKVPVFQTCTLTLMAVLSVMITGVVCGVIFGCAWSQYHIFLAIPMFAGALTSFLLLVFLRFRCAYDGFDDDDDY